MPLEQHQKQKLKKVLEEMLEDLENNNVHLSLIMCNGQASWYGNPFAVLGWVHHIKNVIEKSFQEPSRILTPGVGGNC